MNLFVMVSLTDNTSFPLFQVRRFPANIQMMQGNQTVLHIGSSTHFCCRTNQKTNLSGFYFSKQLRLFCFCICIMNKRNLFFRYTFLYQLLLQVIINIETAIAFRCAQITENQLCGFLCCSIFPDFITFLCTDCYFAFWIIWQ